MIDPAVLRQLGWSEELIQAVTRVAEPMRENPAVRVPLPTSNVHSVSSSAVYADSVVNNSARDFRVEIASEKPAPSS